MTTSQFTATQLAVLAHAVAHNDGQITWFPDNIKGGARTKVLESLAKRDVVICDSLGGWFVCYNGYKALGVEPRVPASTEQIGTTGASQVLADKIDEQDPTDAEIAASNSVDPEIEAAVAAVEAAASRSAEMNSLKAIAVMAYLLAKASPQLEVGERPNSSKIGEAVLEAAEELLGSTSHLYSFHKKVAEALKVFGPEVRRYRAGVKN